jgi:hypothetical protein
MVGTENAFYLESGPGKGLKHKPRFHGESQAKAALFGDRVFAGEKHIARDRDPQCALSSS